MDPKESKLIAVIFCWAVWCIKSKYIDWQENLQSSIFILTNEWYNFGTINNSLWVLFLLLCLLWHTLGIPNLLSVLSLCCYQPLSPLWRFFTDLNPLHPVQNPFYFWKQHLAGLLSGSDACGVRDRGQSFSRGCVPEAGKRWRDWHPLQMDTVQKYLQGSLN